MNSSSGTSPGGTEGWAAAAGAGFCGCAGGCAACTAAHATVAVNNQLLAKINDDSAYVGQA